VTYSRKFLVFALLASGCGAQRKHEKPKPQPQLETIDAVKQTSPLALAGGLGGFKDCSEVEARIEADEILAMQRQIDQQIHWIETGVMDGGVVAADAAMPEQATAGAAGPKDHTSTNNQVEGVEEGDFVKNDGTHVYHVAQGKLHVHQSWPAAEIKELATLDLDGRAFELLLDEEGHRLVVLQNPTSGEMPAWTYDKVEVLTVDVKDPAKPAITSRNPLKGYLLSSRRVGSAVRLVMQSWRPYDPAIKTWLDMPWEQQQSMSKEAKIAELKKQALANVDLIKAKDLAYWLEIPPEQLSGCANVYAPSVPAQSGLTRVASLDLDSNAVSETLLLSRVDEVYASQDDLYLAMHAWESNETFIHKFDIKSPGVAPYLASGRIAGMPLNQFSFDEFNGNLRVAATEGTVNRVVVLAQDGTSLKQIGQTEDLAPGERIMSARFQGERGFVVTYRQVDPLFALDLKDPAAPKVTGALKVPGYSTYLHFTDETHLLGVGRDGAALKISLFDVSDLTAPKEVQTLVMGGDANTSFWSEAEWDQKAFTYFPAKKLLALPITGYTYVSTPHFWWDRYESGLFVFSVDPQAGIQQTGELSMNGLYDGKERDAGWYFGGARVSRSIFADDFVYGVSDFGIRAANVADLKAPVGEVKYKCDDACFDRWGWYMTVD
jgi:uncharacterized secreted protein with C-terminal beta-propeller domain